jgi:Flp pilus assembly protein TadD
MQDLCRIGGRRWRPALTMALLAVFATVGCASAPWNNSPDPLSPNFDPDLYRDLDKKRRMESVPPQRKPPTMEGKLRDGDEARDSGDMGRAMWSYLQAHKLDQSDPIPVERIAMLHMKKDPQRAEALFAYLAKRHPEAPAAQTGIGLARLAKNDLEGASFFLNHALELDPKWVPALTAMAVTNDRLSRHDEAQEYYARALRLGARDYETFNNLGVSYIASGRYMQAVKTLKKAILMEHRDPAVHNNLGLALGRLGRYDEAMSEFQKGGDERAALNNLAYVYYLNGENDKAVELYEQALLVACSSDRMTRSP